MTVRMVDLAAQWRSVGDDVLRATARVGNSGWYILGPEVTSFEQELSGWFGRAHVAGCASGLDALELGLRAAGLRPGDHVLTTPLSAFATTLAIIRAGGVPVFVDTDARGAIDLERCADLLSRDERIRFLLPVHLYGCPVDLDGVERLATAHDVTVVEDCAQAIGAVSGGRPVGTVGSAAGVSFYPTKNLGALGDAGAVVAGDPSVADLVRSLRDYGQTAKYRHDHLGANSRLDELHAAILRSCMLPRLSSWTARRTQLADRYRELLTGSALELLDVPEGATCVWHLFPILVRDARSRDDFRRHLRDAGVETAVHYPTLIPDQAALRHVAGWRVVGRLTRATDRAARSVSLPLHPFMSTEDVDVVVAAVRSWQP